MVSWADFKKKPISNKIVLVEVDLAKVQDGFINGGAGNWKYTYNSFKTGTFNLGNGSLGYGNLGGTATEGGDQLAPDVIGSVFISGEEYTEVSTYALMKSTNKSWFYDVGIYTLYIHFDNENPASFFTVSVGFVFGLSNKAITINNRYYEPRLVSVPSLSKSKDLLYFGVISFDGGQLDLLNNDGFFDGWADLAIFGQPVTIKYGGDDLAYADYYDLYKGYIENAVISWDRFTLQIADNKKRLSRTVPINRFNTTEYPDLRERNIGKPIPFPFGWLINVPCICCNEEESPTPGNYSFAISDLLQYPGGVQWIVQAYVDGVKTAMSFIRPLGGTTFNEVAFFGISSGNYTSGQKVTVDIIGIGTRNLVSYSDCELTSEPRLLQWVETAPSQCTWARDSAQAYQGTYSYKITKTVAAGTAAYANICNESNTDLLNTIQGKQLTFTAWVYVPSTGGCALNECVLRIADNDGGGFTFTDSGNPTAFDTWERLTVTRTMRTGLTTVRFQVRMESTAANGEIYYADAIQIEQAATETDWIRREHWNDILELIPHLIDEYEDIPFISDFYDLTEWATAQANALNAAYGLLIDKEIELIELIEKCGRTLFGNFIVKDDGKFTFRIFDSAASPSDTVGLSEQFEPQSIDYQAVDFLSAVVIEYREDHETGEFSRYEDNSRQTAIVSEYKKYTTKLFETLLYNDADAITLATAIYDYMDTVLPIVTIDTTIEFIDTEIGDVLTFDVSRISGGLLGEIDVEIVSITKDIMRGRTVLVGREMPT